MPYFTGKSAAAPVENPVVSGGKSDTLADVQKHALGVFHPVPEEY